MLPILMGSEVSIMLRMIQRFRFAYLESWSRRSNFGQTKESRARARALSQSSGSWEELGQAAAREGRRMCQKPTVVQCWRLVMADGRRELLRPHQEQRLRVAVPVAQRANQEHQEVGLDEGRSPWCTAGRGRRQQCLSAELGQTLVVGTRIWLFRWSVDQVCLGSDGKASRDKQNLTEPLKAELRQWVGARRAPARSMVPAKTSAPAACRPSPASGHHTESP